MGARLKKKITEAHKAVNSTRKQLALIKKVIKVVKHMNKTYHDDANNKFTDIKPVMDMLYTIVSNLKVETDLIKRNIVNITTKVGLKEKALNSEVTAFADAEAKHSNASARLDNTTGRLNAEIEEANNRMAAIGMERDDCVKEVSADSRTHEESMQVLDFIIAYFQKLLGYEGGSNATVVAGNSTPNETETETETETEVEPKPKLQEEPTPTVVANATEEKLSNPNGTKTGAQVMHDLVMKMTAKANKPPAEEAPAPVEEEAETGVVAQKTTSVQA